MKRLYGLFVLLCLMLTACNDDFLDVDPVDRYSDAVVWTDESAEFNLQMQQNSD